MNLTNIVGAELLLVLKSGSAHTTPFVFAWVFFDRSVCVTCVCVSVYLLEEKMSNQLKAPRHIRLNARRPRVLMLPEQPIINIHMNNGKTVPVYGTTAPAAGPGPVPAGPWNPAPGSILM